MLKIGSQSAAAIAPQKKLNMSKSRKKRNRVLHLMLLPTVLLLIVYRYVPMFGIVIAFQKFNIMLGLRSFIDSQWVGLKNYIDLINMGILDKVIFNSLYISLWKTVTMFVIPIVLALMLNEIRRNGMRRSIQTILYLPFFVSWVIMAGILKQILSGDGLMNSLLEGIGLSPLPFLSSNQYFVPVLILTNIWKEMGFSTIIYLAAIVGIDQQMYEAAIIDGASRWKQTLHVTLPGMTPIVVLMLILSLQGVLDAGFDQIFNLYSIPVYETSDIIDTFVYRISFGQGRFEIGAAVGLFRSVVSFVLISVSYWMAYKVAKYRIF